MTEETPVADILAQEILDAAYQKGGIDVLESLIDSLEDTSNNNDDESLQAWVDSVLEFLNGAKTATLMAYAGQSPGNLH